MLKILTTVLGSLLLLAACSGEPTESNQPSELDQTTSAPSTDPAETPPVDTAEPRRLTLTYFEIQG